MEKTIEKKQKWAREEFLLLQDEEGEKAVFLLWKKIRKGEFSAADRRLRAPNPFWAVAQNTSATRSYRCPLGQWLELEEFSKTFGHFHPKWPQTKKSKKECQRTKKELLEWFLGSFIVDDLGA